MTIFGSKMIAKKGLDFFSFEILHGPSELLLTNAKKQLFQDSWFQCSYYSCYRLCGYMHQKPSQFRKPTLRVTTPKISWVLEFSSQIKSIGHLAHLAGGQNWKVLRWEISGILVLSFPHIERTYFFSVLRKVVYFSNF